MLKGSEFSFRLEVEDAFRVSGWSQACLTVDVETETALLSEAVLVFLLCSRTEQLLASLPGSRQSLRRQQLLVEYAEGLFSLERPEQFLINRHEIELMRTLYKEWDLGTHVRVAKDRVGQSIANVSFFAEQKEKSQANLMNLLLGAIAVLSAAEVVPGVLDAVVGRAVPGVVEGLVGAAIVLVMWGIVRYVALPTFERLRSSRTDQRELKRVNQQSETASQGSARYLGV